MRNMSNVGRGGEVTKTFLGSQKSLSTPEAELRNHLAIFLSRKKWQHA